MISADSFVRLLHELGATIEIHTTTAVYATLHRARWRFLLDKQMVHAGGARTFDTWSNSTDWVARLPRTEKEMVALVRLVEKLERQGSFDANHGRADDVTELAYGAPASRRSATSQVEVVRGGVVGLR